MTTSSPVAAVDRAVLAELVPNGVLRAAINFGNSVLALGVAAWGDAVGVWVVRGRELGRRLGVPTALVSFDAAGKVVEALKEGAWDLAFLAIDPKRGAEMLFTAPYVLIEGAYLVAEDSPLHSNAEVDRDGVRIATGSGAAYELHLTRSLRHATLERHGTAREAFDRLAAGEVEAAAGVRQMLMAYARQHGGLRVLQPSFMAIAQAMGTPVGRDAAARYLNDFIEEMKASGFVAQALARSGQGDAIVAPAS
jgi:polar amino acid transport system substrate-binding protein